MANTLTFVTLACALSLVSLTLAPTSLADDRKAAPELIRSRGFDVDEFDVISQDYVLKVYRIINPLANPTKLHAIPVVAAHGISFDVSNMLASSTHARPRRPRPKERVTLYTMQNGTDDRSLYFYLSNNNYDVWFVESRATNQRNSRQLKSKDPNVKSFWDFSLDEQAMIDLPLQLDFVLQQTKAPRLAFIAYSQSTTMFALLSMRPQYSQKLACFVAIAPVVFTTHIQGLVRPLVKAMVALKLSTATRQIPEVLMKVPNFLLTYMCSVSFIRDTLCQAFWESVSGKEKKGVLLEGGMVEDVIKSTSFKTFEQYLENSDRGDFRMYDYKDDMRNSQEYGQPFPPEYNLSNINLRSIVLFRGLNDLLSNPHDQSLLLSRLKVPPAEDHILEDYSHIDFFISPTVVRDVNEPILRALDRFTGRDVVRESHLLTDQPVPMPPAAGSPLDGKNRELLGAVESRLKLTA